LKDDLKRIAHAQEVAAGKHRTKRRDRGVGFEDSDSEDDDEEARNARIRQKMYSKRRRLDGEDKLDSLSKNPETQAFVASYQEGTNDDAAEFSHLGEDTLVENEQDGSESDDENSPQVITTGQLRREVLTFRKGRRRKVTTCTILHG